MNLCWHFWSPQTSREKTYEKGIVRLYSKIERQKPPREEGFQHNLSTPSPLHTPQIYIDYRHFPTLILECYVHGLLYVFVYKCHGLGQVAQLLFSTWICQGIFSAAVFIPFSCQSLCSCQSAICILNLFFLLSVCFSLKTQLIFTINFLEPDIF